MRVNVAAGILPASEGGILPPGKRLWMAGAPGSFHAANSRDTFLPPG